MNHYDPYKLEMLINEQINWKLVEKRLEDLRVNQIFF